MVRSQTNTSRREAILSAAERVFSEVGYANATMDAVAAEASLAKGSLYNYFDNKEDLCNQVLEHVIQSVWAENRVDLLAGRSASEKIATLIDYWFDRLDYFRQFGRLVFEFWAAAAREQQAGPLAGTFSEIYRGSEEIVDSVLAQGIERGEFRHEIDASVGAALIIAMMDGVTVRAILDPGLKLDGEFVEAIKRAILSGLVVDNGEEANGAEGSGK